jgi:hypothetical protein
MSWAARLLSPDLHYIAAKGMSLMALAKYLAVGSSDGQRC